MNKRDLQPALDALKTIKMPKIESKELRAALIRLHFALLGEYRKFTAGIEDLRTVYLGAYQDEIAEVAPLEAEMMNPATSQERRAELDKMLRAHADLQEAAKTFNAECEKLASEPVEIEKIDAESFLAEAAEQGLGLDILESLYPILT